MEARWRVLVEMCHAYLAQVNPPKPFWFWGLWEAYIRSNFLPIIPNLPQDPDCLAPVSLVNPDITTSFELMYLTPPDLQVLFKWGGGRLFLPSRFWESLRLQVCLPDYPGVGPWLEQPHVGDALLGSPQCEPRLYPGRAVCPFPGVSWHQL